MSSLQYHAPIARRRSRKRSSPLLSVAALMAVSALLALVQAVSADPVMRAAKALVHQVQVVHQTGPAAKPE